MTDAASVHRTMFDVVQNRDFAALRALYHPDYVYVSGDGSEQKGADAGVAVAETYMTAFPDMRMTVEHQWEPRDDVSIIEMRAVGTHQAELEGIPASGRRVELIGCNVVELRDGLIVREREYFDGASLLQQIGALDG